MKFFTIVFFILISPLYSIGQGIQLYNQQKAKKISIPIQQRIEFTLYSDSILTFDYLDEGNILGYTDSSLILNSDREILISDFKSISVFPKQNRKLKGFSVSFLFAGIGILTKGIVMLAGEGLESKNKENAPLFIAGGTIITTVASIPFWSRKKTYNLQDEKWQLIVL